MQIVLIMHCITNGGIYIEGVSFSDEIYAVAVFSPISVVFVTVDGDSSSSLLMFWLALSPSPSRFCWRGSMSVICHLLRVKISI